MPDQPIDPRVYVALDFANPMHALALVDKLDPRACGLKVGKEMFVVAGPEPVRWMIERGFNVFLDLKFHDIPNTVAQACAAAARLGVTMMTVHASGGPAMLRAARDAVNDASIALPPTLLAVTVLTSLSDDDLRATGHDETSAPLALRLATLARDCGLGGIVCSALEAPVLRASLGRDVKLVTPGIRPRGSAADDQARIITPEAAIANGADYLVIGRPITQAPDPVAALANINRSLGIAA